MRLIPFDILYEVHKMTLQTDAHLQRLVREELLSAVYLARSAALAMGDSSITLKYRERALERIYSHLAFAVPHILKAFPPGEFTDKYTMLFSARDALDDKYMASLEK